MLAHRSSSLTSLVQPREEPADDSMAFGHGLVNALAVVDLRLQLLARTSSQCQLDLIGDSRRSLHEALDTVQQIASLWQPPTLQHDRLAMILSVVVAEIPEDAEISDVQLSVSAGGRSFTITISTDTQPGDDPVH